MAKENKTRYAILGILSMDPASGYEIKKKMEKSTDHFWREGDSSIYPILKQLLDEGMVTCELGNTESKKPKKIYSLTNDGHQELIDWLATEAISYPYRNEFLLKVFFGWNVGAKVTINHIESFRRRVKSALDKYKETAKLFAEKKISGQRIYRYLTIKAGIVYSEANLQWCDEAIRLLRK